MKNTFKISVAIALICSIFFACKKDTEETKVEEQKTSLVTRATTEEITPDGQQFSITIQVVSTDGKPENGLIIGTKAELEKVLQDKSGKVYLKKVAKKNNLFVPTGTGTTGPDNPADPNKLCWDEIDAIYNANLTAWRAQANQTCKPVWQCLTCPSFGSGVYVFYIIEPTSPKCVSLPAVTPSFATFKFNKGEYDSEDVANYISANLK